MGIEQTAVESRGLVKSCLLLQRLGIECASKGGTLVFNRHLTSVNFHLIQAGNSKSVPRSIQFRIKRGRARKRRWGRGEFTGCIVCAPKRERGLRVSFVDPFRLGQEWNRLLRFASAQIVIAEKQIGHI